MTISPALFPAVTVTVVRDRKIRTALRTNQIAGFVTVPSWKKIKQVIFVIFPFLVEMFSKTNTKHVLRVSIEFYSSPLNFPLSVVMWCPLEI